MKFLRKLQKKGMGMIEGVIALAIFIIVVASVLLPTVFDTNTTGWDTGTVNLWNTIGIIATAGVILVVYRVTSGGA